MRIKSINRLRFTGENVYVILVYDIDVSRVSKVMKICRRYLFHVQNSVFEGEITKANLIELKLELNKVIDKGYDSIILFEFETINPKYVHRELLGIEKKPRDFII